jgi:AraC family transcriptional regulator
MHTLPTLPQRAPIAVRHFPVMTDAWDAASSGEFDIIVPAGRSDAVVISLEREFFLRRAREETGGEAPPLAERSSTVDPLLLGIASVLGADLRAGRSPSEGVLEAFALCIATHLSRHPGGGMRMRRQSGLAHRKLEQVRSFIEQHLAEPLLVERLAAVVYLSPFHFARLFKLTTGTSPHAFITARRVERAKELLRARRLPLVEIAAEVGFQTQGHFTEVFHRFAGTTPRRFRLASGLDAGPEGEGRNREEPRAADR